MLREVDIQFCNGDMYILFRSLTRKAKKMHVSPVDVRVVERKTLQMVVNHFTIADNS